MALSFISHFTQCINVIHFMSAMAELNNESNNRSYLSELRPNSKELPKIIPEHSAESVTNLDMDIVSASVTNLDMDTVSSSMPFDDMDNVSVSFPYPTVDNVSVSPSIFSDVPGESSCKGKCGQTQSLPCNCDIRCVVYKNCCQDFSAVCPSTLKVAHGKFKHLLNLIIECRHGKLFIASCHSQRNETKKSSIITPYSFSLIRLQSLVYHPVTDLTTGLSYINGEIFQCNSDNQSVPVLWDLVINDFDSSHLQTFTRRYLYNKDATQGYSFIEGQTLNKCCLGFQCQCIRDADKVTKAESFVRETQNIFFAQGRNSSQIYDVKQNNAKKKIGENSINTCKILNLNQATMTSLTVSFQGIVIYSGHVLNIIPLNKSHPKFWENIQCDTNFAMKGIKQCHITCNSAFGFVKRVNSCLRLHFYYVALPSSPLLDELHKMVSIPQLVNCLLKNELLFDSLDEWLPGRELFAPVSNTTFYTMTFLMYAVEERIKEEPKFTSLMRSLPLLMSEFKSRSARLNLCKDITTTQRSKVNASRDRVELSDLYWLKTFPSEAVCFQKKPVLLFSEIGENFKYNLTLPTLTCDTQSIVEDFFEFRSQLNSSWCLNVKNKSQISSSVNKTILDFLGIVVILALLTASEIV